MGLAISTTTPSQQMIKWSRSKDCASETEDGKRRMIKSTSTVKLAQKFRPLLQETSKAWLQARENSRQEVTVAGEKKARHSLKLSDA